MHVLCFEAPAKGGAPQPKPQPGDPQPGDGSREPLINADGPVVVLSVGLLVLYWISTFFPAAAVQQAFAVSPVLLAEGHWARLVSAIFVHGAWAHALIDAAMALAFGALVSDVLGAKLRGAAAYFAFFLTCGIIGFLAFAALRWGHTGLALGASGAASGLMGAAARIVGGDGRIGPMFSPAVLRMGGGWLVVNVIMAFSGNLLIPGGAFAVAGWQPHLAGFVAGALLIGPFARLALAVAARRRAAGAGFGDARVFAN
jgi:membrane associated rhomboid family serine protease